MRVVILTNDQANQWALAHKIARVADLRAIVLSRNQPRKPPRRPARLLLNRIEGRLVGRPFVGAWFEMMERYRGVFPARPDVETVRVANVNDAETIACIQRHAPCLVVVSGTNLVGKAVIAEADKHRGIVNLHTGISPYVKGGPNCTNWCLATGEFHLIGNTVMWLDPGIDTGPLIATERTPLTGDESLPELHWKVMEHAHDLYVRAIVAIREGRQVSRTPQGKITEGHTFYTADWSARPMMKAYLNFRLRYSPKGVARSLAAAPPTQLIDLPAP